MEEIICCATLRIKQEDNILFSKQKRAIISVFAGKDTIVRLPTGHGKSIVFEIIPDVIRTDIEKKISRLENKVEDYQEEMKSLQQTIQQLEKRLQILEANSEFSEIQIQPAVPTLHACQSGQSFC